MLTGLGRGLWREQKSPAEASPEEEVLPGGGQGSRQRGIQQTWASWLRLRKDPLVTVPDKMCSLGSRPPA